MSHEYLEYYELQSGGSRGRGGIPRVFVGSPYQRGHGIGGFLGGLFRRVLPYLGKGVRAIGKEALRAGINIIDDIGNDIPLKEAAKTRFKESGANLKRKAEEKISSLMKGSGYKRSKVTRRSQFPLDRLSAYIAKSKIRKRRRNSVKNKKNHKKVTQKKKKKKTVARKRNNSTVIKRRRPGKKRTVSDIFS